MTRSSPAPGGSAILLFDEDFDQQPPPSEPEVIEPVFTAADLIAARQEAAQESRERTLEEVEGSVRAATSRALAAIAEQLAAARAEVASIAEQSAEAIARLLLDCFATAFPVLSARHGPAELAAIALQILPAVHYEPAIAVRIHPCVVPKLTEAIASLDADVAARVRLIPTEGLSPADVRITWANGSAVRDTAALWRQIEDILAAAGLWSVEATAKEQELVE